MLPTSQRPDPDYATTTSPALLRGVGNEPSSKNRGKISMKTILSALVALSVIAGIAGTASAFDTKTFYEQIDRDHN